LVIPVSEGSCFPKYLPEVEKLDSLYTFLNKVLAKSDSEAFLFENHRFLLLKCFPYQIENFRDDSNPILTQFIITCSTHHIWST